MVSLLYFFLSLSIALWGFVCNGDRKRQIIVLICFFLSLCLVITAQINLYDIGLAFNPSDPGEYYYLSGRARSVGELLRMVDGSSNVYYFVINYFFYNELNSPHLASVILKICNLFFFLGLYCIATRNIKFSSIEYLILFHPYFFVVIVRNVRDLQILGFTFVILAEMGRVSKNKFIYFSYFLLFFLRPFFAIYTFLLQVFYSRIFLKKRHILAFVMAGLVVLLLSDIGYLAIIGRVVAAYGYYNDYNATYSVFVEKLFNFDRSASFLLSIIGLVAVGFVRFIFTPIFPNYFEKYYVNQPNDIFMMYTDIDMALVFVGVLLNVFVCIPLLFKVIYDRVRGEPLSPFLCMSIFIVFMYSVFHLGGTDIRIRYSFIFFLLVSFLGVSSAKILSDTYRWVLPVSIVIFYIPMIMKLTEIII